MNSYRYLGLVIALAGTLSLFGQSPAHVRGRLLVGRRDAIDGNLLLHTWQQHKAVERRWVAQLGLHVIEAPEESLESIRRSLLQTGLFDYVEPDYYAETGSTAPNDPSYIAQWHLPRIGSANTGR